MDNIFFGAAIPPSPSSVDDKPRTFAIEISLHRAILRQGQTLQVFSEKFHGLPYRTSYKTTLNNVKTQLRPFCISIH